MSVIVLNTHDDDGRSDHEYNSDTTVDHNMDGNYDEQSINDEYIFVGRSTSLDGIFDGEIFNRNGGFARPFKSAVK